MLVARPATLDDAEALFELARLAGPGFTSMAVGEEALYARLKKSVASFSGKSAITPSHTYMLMAEDLETGEVVGMSAVKAQVGIGDPFFNFRVLKIAQKSSVTDKRFDMDVLILVNEYTGASEVGSLYVKKSARGTGAGRLISQARYMLMAADETRFSDTVVSELRGHVDENGYSPFWEALGQKFFDMEFNEADQISAEKDNQFILDLMPKYPIYAALLPEAAQEVIGKTHPLGEGARRYLEAEGFRYSGLIDIFDAGPSVTAPRADIRTIRDSQVLKVHGDDTGDLSLTGLISNNKLAEFRCVLNPIGFEGNELNISSNSLKSLNINDGESVRVWVKR